MTDHSLHWHHVAYCYIGVDAGQGSQQIDDKTDMKLSYFVLFNEPSVYFGDGSWSKLIMVILLYSIIISFDILLTSILLSNKTE